MPKPPRFPSPRGQQLAVGVVTLVVFGVAIGLAQIYTQSKQVSYDVQLAAGRVDELVLPLPVAWVRDNPKATDDLFTGRPALLMDPVVIGRQLSIARIDFPEAVASEAVLKRLLVGINRRGVLQNPEARRFRGLSSVGVSYSGVRQVDDVGIAMSDYMVVLTEDQRRHWMILLSMPTRSSESAERANEALLMRIALAADDTAILNVNPDPDNPAPEPASPR